MNYAESEKFLTDIKIIASRMDKNMAIYTAGEEATKTSLVLPFFMALGYDIFDTEQVWPEFTADVGVKNGEKVDYALMFNGLPKIIVECKKLFSLNNEKSFNDGYSQLFRYFSVTDCSIAILTDGDIVIIFSDTKEKNVMDSEPIMKFRITDIPKDSTAASISMQLHRNNFSKNNIIQSCTGLNLYNNVKNRLSVEMDNPSDSMCKLLMADIYDGRLTAGAIEANRGIIRGAMQDFFAEKDRPSFDLNATQEEDDGIITTQDEIEAFVALKTIARIVCENPPTLEMRDAKTYCTILQHYPDGSKSILMRLFFDKKNKYFELFDGTKHQVDTDFIYTVTSTDIFDAIQKRLQNLQSPKEKE